MPVSAWENVGQGVAASALGAVPGVVVNGASDAGGGYTPPAEGRIYPAPRTLASS